MAGITNAADVTGNGTLMGQPLASVPGVVGVDEEDPEDVEPEPTGGGKPGKDAGRPVVPWQGLQTLMGV